MQPINEVSKPGKPKLKLNSIPTKSRFLLDKETGSTPLTASKEIHNHETCETLEAFNEKYQMLDKIGQGANGVVYKCRHKKLDKIFAVKKSRTEIQSIPHLKASYNQTKRLEHDSIIHYKGLYIAPQKRVSYLVMEYFEHPELCKVKLKDHNEVSKIAYQLLEAVAYMHKQKICQRDIKPDNILYDQQNEQIKVTDFGESKATHDGRLVKQMMTCTGTLQYKAPELFRGGVYDQLIDEWAAGVTIYELMTGKKPFDSQYKRTIIDNIENCRVSFEENFWSKHPQRWAKQLIEQLLSPRSTRITADRALQNLWFEGHASMLRSITFKPTIKRLPSIGFESMAVNNIRGKNDKKQTKGILSSMRLLTNSQLIDSDDSYMSDEDEELFEKDNKSEQKLKSINLENSSTQCKSPLYKDEEEEKSLITQDSTLLKQNSQQY